MISIICPVYNEEKYIELCIYSILAQDYPKDKLEVFFVDGISSDMTRDIIKKFSSQYKFIYLLDNIKRNVPSALNIGIKAAKGDVIIRIDAHAEYPNNYFSTLRTNLDVLNAENVGAVCKTIPINNSNTSKAIAVALEHPFAVGNSYFRIGAKKVMEVDTVPFGCFKRELFERIGLFDEDLIRNQDDEFNARIIKSGGKIYLLPNLEIKYYARDKISKVSKMFYQYGLFKPLVNRRVGSLVTIRQFFPLLFFWGLIIGVMLCLFCQKLIIVYAIIILLYLFLSLFFSVSESIRFKNRNMFFILPIIFFIIHVSYGWGYTVGLYKLFTKQKFGVETNR